MGSADCISISNVRLLDVFIAAASKHSFPKFNYIAEFPVLQANFCHLPSIKPVENAQRHLAPPPESRGIMIQIPPRSPLLLFVLRIFTDHHDLAFSLDDLAFFTDWLY